MNLFSENYDRLRWLDSCTHAPAKRAETMPKAFTRSRRGFLVALGTAGFEACRRARVEVREPSPRTTLTGERPDHVFRMRRDAAVEELRRSRPLDTVNGDEERYPARFASYTKGLPHTETGEVDLSAYEALLAALRSGNPAEFARIPLGGTLRLSNPEAAFTYALEGVDSHTVDLAAPPAFASAEAAADMAEDYWHAILRDVPFETYDQSDLVHAAADDLSRFSDYQGPTKRGHVDASVLFRGQTSGDVVGPYVSQFLYARVPHGVYSIEQRFRQPVPQRDYVTTFMDWLAIQRGSEGSTDVSLQPDLHYIRSGRDLARYVHRDYTFQAFQNAALILLSFGERYLSPTPYHRLGCQLSGTRTLLTTESGFCTFGPPHVLDAVTAVAMPALHATWRQKWLLHRRLRPEVFAERVDRVVYHGATYPVHADLLGSRVQEFLPAGNMLLPLAYPEGAPAHPSYPAAHAAMAGACATVLKAFFREDMPFPAAARPAADGLSLVPYEGEALTIGGELNKLASNIAIARNFAGVHYRSDGVQGLNLGEIVAIEYLRDVRRCLTETFDGFALTKFSGEAITI